VTPVLLPCVPHPPNCSWSLTTPHLVIKDLPGTPFSRMAFCSPHRLRVWAGCKANHNPQRLKRGTSPFRAPVQHCHSVCPERSRRDRSGPIFSSAPNSGASGRAARFMCVFCISVAFAGAPRALRRGGRTAAPPSPRCSFSVFQISLFEFRTLASWSLISLFSANSASSAPLCCLFPFNFRLLNLFFLPPDR